MIVYGIITSLALGELSSTWILLVQAVSSVAVEVVFTNATLGAESSSPMVKVWVVGLASPAPFGIPRVRITVSFDSSILS